MTNEQKLNELKGQKATIFKMSEMGFPQSIQCEIKDVYNKNYAQFENMLHIVYRPKSKRSDYVLRIYNYSTTLIYKGFVNLKADMWVGDAAISNGLVIRESLVGFCADYFEIAKNSTNEKPFIIFKENL